MSKFNLGIGLITKYGMRYKHATTTTTTTTSESNVTHTQQLNNESNVTQKQQLTDALIIMRMVQIDGFISQINSYLYIGSIGSAYNHEELIKHNITHIICATSKAKEMFTQTITYYTIDIEDTLQEDITPILPSFFTFIDSVRINNENHKILIHCFQGKSRASILCIAYMMYCIIRTNHQSDHYNKEDNIRELFCSTLDIVRTCRSVACPNDSFRRQIITFFQQQQQQNHLHFLPSSTI